MKNPNEMHKNRLNLEQVNTNHPLFRNKLMGWRTSLLLLILAFIFHFTGSFNSYGRNTDQPVQKAYELRMNGKVDDAKKLLDDLLAKDSTNAMAYYELARIQTYMFTAQAKVSLDDVIHSINKAVQIDPKNAIYAYFKATSYFLRAFMAMQGDQKNVKSRVAETCAEFERVLQLKPDYHEAMLYLVEIYGMLPRDMGGDSVKASIMVEKLTKMNSYFGAKARMAVAPENTDKVKFWNNMLLSDKNNSNILAELCKVYLFQHDIENAKKFSNLSIALDPSQNILLLAQARYHILTVMQNKDKAATELPLARKDLEIYLISKPEPIVPLKAYVLGLKAIIEMSDGNQPGADKLITEAKALDPYFSRALGIPLLILFDKPDQVSHHFVSFFSPF
jgi:tetratricopeptide (TPR) repeat protein